MLLNCHDEIVETRTWSSGTEIVARVNWSHIARVRGALGLGGEEFSRSQLGRSAKPGGLTLHVKARWPTAAWRAA
jgi:hypothetical protein